MRQENEIAKVVREQFEGVINVHMSPLPNVAPIQIVVPAGAMIADHIPECKLPWVCVANGVPLKREYWLTRPVYAGDTISMCPVVLGGGGGNSSRSILAAVAIIIIAIFAPYAAAALGATGAGAAALSAGIVMVGTALVNAVIAPKEEKQQGQQANNTYNVAASANQAKLNQPIPVGYGRLRTYPDYAAQPYTEYTTETNEDGDQYFYALYAIGQGEYNITAVMLGDTAISSFRDVDYKILRPGEAPTIVNPMVVTGVEAGGQILSTTPVGPFVACGPSRRITHIGIDLTFAKGLTDIHIPTGKAGPISVTVFVDIVEVNDAFKLLGEWKRLATEVIRGSSVTPQRRSFKYAVPEHKRYAVRLTRANEQSRNVDHYDEITWSAMRGYLAGEAPLAANTTHLELRMRATEQLNSLSQRKIGVLWQRLLRTWHPDTGMSELMTTRNPMWALLDKWLDPVYGDRMPLERVDLENIYALAQIADARKDRFDYIFEVGTTSYEADQLIARVMRSVPVRRNGVRSVVRDEKNDLPVTAYTARNILRDSTSMQYMQITEETADGIILEYFDRNAFDWIEIECPAPGRTYTYPDHEGYNPDLPSMENPVRLRIDGITGPLHAEREGLYQAAANVLRRKYASWSTEMQGVLASYGAPVIFAPQLHNSVQSGDCAFFEPGVNLLSLSEQPRLTPTSQIVLIRPDGSTTAPIKVGPGVDEWQVRLATVPDFELVLSDSRRERTKYVLMDSQEHKTLCKVLSIRPQSRSSDGAQTYELFAVVEDNKVHEVDNHLIPAPDEDPDAPEQWAPDDAVPDVPPPPPPPPTERGPYEIVSFNVNSPADKPYFILGNNGVLTKKYRGLEGATTEVVEGYWFANSPQPNIGWDWLFQVSRPIAATGDTGEDGSIAFMWVKQLEQQAIGNMYESEWLQLTADFRLEMDDQTDMFEGTIKFATRNGVIQSTHRLYMEAKKGAI